MTELAGTLLALALASGCQRLSVSRMPSVPLSPGPSTRAATSAPPAWTPPGLLVDQVVDRRPPAAPAPEPVPIALSEPPSTPLLDAALRRVKLEEAAEVPETPVATVAEPEPAPTPTPTPAHEPKPEPEPIPHAVVVPPAATEPTAAEAPKADPKVEAAAVLVPDRVEEPEGRLRPIDPEKPAGPPGPRDTWREGLDRLRSVAHDHVDPPGGAADGPWALRSRLLDWLLEASTEATTVRGAVDTLEAMAPLEVVDLQLCRKVKGFGDFETLDASSCRPGHGVIIYCEMAGVRYASEGTSHRSRLASRVEVLAPTGGDPVWTHSLGTADDLCRRRRRDYYVNYRLTLPDTLAPGTYELRLIQDDLVAHHSASSSIPLIIQP